MTLQKFFQEKYHELVLKKNLTLYLNECECHLELIDEGKTLCLLSVLNEGTQVKEEGFLDEVEALEIPGLCIDRRHGQILIAKKHSFEQMLPAHFGLRVAQFYSLVQHYKNDIDGLMGKEYAYIKRH